MNLGLARVRPITVCTFRAKQIGLLRVKCHDAKIQFKDAILPTTPCNCVFVCQYGDVTSCEASSVIVHCSPVVYNILSLLYATRLSFVCFVVFNISYVLFSSFPFNDFFSSTKHTHIEQFDLIRPQFALGFFSVK